MQQPLTISFLSVSGRSSSSSGGSWHGDSYRDSGRRGFGQGSSGAMQEDVEASHSEIFIQVCCHQYLYIVRLLLHNVHWNCEFGVKCLLPIYIIHELFLH